MSSNVVLICDQVLYEVDPANDKKLRACDLDAKFEFTADGTLWQSCAIHWMARYRFLKALVRRVELRLIETPRKRSKSTSRKDHKE